MNILGRAMGQAHSSPWQFCVNSRIMGAVDETRLGMGTTHDIPFLYPVTFWREEASESPSSSGQSP